MELENFRAFLGLCGIRGLIAGALFPLNAVPAPIRVTLILRYGIPRDKCVWLPTSMLGIDPILAPLEIAYGVMAGKTASRSNALVCIRRMRPEGGWREECREFIVLLCYLLAPVYEYQGTVYRTIRTSTRYGYRVRYQYPGILCARHNQTRPVRCTGNFCVPGTVPVYPGYQGTFVYPGTHTVYHTVY